MSRLREIVNIVYAAAARECEATEHSIAPLARIHGHHMAQRIALDVEQRLRADPRLASLAEEVPIK